MKTIKFSLATEVENEMVDEKNRSLSDFAVGNKDKLFVELGTRNRWGISNHVYFGLRESVSKLPAGLYSLTNIDGLGIAFIPTPLKSDDLIFLPDLPVQRLMSNVEKFWKSEAAFKKLGFLHKRGILLWGTAGVGKTSIVRILINSLIERDGVVVFSNSPAWTIEGLALLRRVEPYRPVINIMEDIDEFVRQKNMPIVLSLLDGENQISNVVHVATTNYPQDLEERLLQRPSRFDEVIEVKPPSYKARLYYLQQVTKGAVDERSLGVWATDTDGMSIAYLRELVIAVKCLDLPYEETIDRLRGNWQKAPKRDERKSRETAGLLPSGREYYEPSASSTAPTPNPARADEAHGT